MKRNILLILILAVVQLLNAGTSFSIKDASGNELVFEKKIERIISLSPAVTESIFILGKGKNLVGVTKYCVRPVEATKIEKIGGVVDPNIEKIVSLNPDVVIVIDQFSVVKKIEELKNYGIKIFILGQRKDFDSIINEFSLLGKLLGAEELSLKLIDESKKEISVISNNVKKIKNKHRVFWQIGVKPIFTAGKKTFPDNMINLAGGINIADGFENYKEFSIEKVVELNPDIIISPQMGSLRDNVKIWENYKSINAFKNNKIFVIDENDSSAPTITTYVKTVKALYSYFYN